MVRSCVAGKEADVTQAFLDRITGRLRRDWHKARFEAVARRVFDTPPLQMTGDSPIFVSQLRERDVAAYLLAIKSLYRRIGSGRVCVLNDGSLTADSRVLLAQHLPALDVVDISTIDTGPCPRGGTWERLCKIIELSQERYVIQVDADTLTVADVPEVRECWKQRVPFLLGTGAGLAVSTAAEVAEMVQGWIKRYGWSDLSLSVEAEAALGRLPNPHGVAYVHASSGFAGFAPGMIKLKDLYKFSGYMTDLIGPERWHAWGSEQIASNYVLANVPGAVVLPYRRYACVEPGTPVEGRVFLHFLGTYRYEKPSYRHGARRVLTEFK